ncbi:hypothetical protein, partial [Vibrio cholerae]|uniref:hypothetical protein n=1 Tax=Vibrio cholerae TaxID=666 RepID=UPI00301BB26C
YSDLGFKILESFQEIFDNSVIESSKEDGVYSVLRLASNITIKRSGPQFSDMTLSGRSVLIVPNNTGTDYD